MDLSKLKNRASFPFETIAVAASFSPQCKAILQIAKHLADLFHSTLIIIHIGKKTNDYENLLDALMQDAGINSKTTRVIWMEGDPVETILKICKLNIVDLLILGANQKENLFKFYVGSIARNISRRAKTSVLLLINPDSQTGDFKKIIVNGVENPKTKHTINTALYVANNLHIKEITIANEVDVPGLPEAITKESSAPEAKEIKKQLVEEKEEKLQSAISQYNNNDIKINIKIIKGKPGYAISKYAKDKAADLLVINSPDTNLNLLDRIFTHDIEFILAELPCNVLIVHSRVNADHGKIST